MKNTVTTQYLARKMKPADAALLNEYQHARFDPNTGLVWIEDGTAGVAHSAHPNVEANRYNRRRYPNYMECRGFLYSPAIFTSTELDKLAARLCLCPYCVDAREHGNDPA